MGVVQTRQRRFDLRQLRHRMMYISVPAVNFSTKTLISLEGEKMIISKQKNALFVILKGLSYRQNVFFFFFTS